MFVPGGIGEHCILSQHIFLVGELVTERMLECYIVLDAGVYRHVRLPIHGCATCDSMVVSTFA